MRSGSSRRAQGTKDERPEIIITLMSRVTYVYNPATADQESLRNAHQVRPVSHAQEGTGVKALPGDYEFNFAP